MYATQINKCARRCARGDHEYVFAESAQNKRHKGRPNLLSTPPNPFLAPSPPLPAVKTLILLIIAHHYDNRC